MFYIKFCIKCDWNFGGFLKMQITFYKQISKIINENNVQQNYLSIELLPSPLAKFFVKKSWFLSRFLWNPAFGMRVYKGKIEVRNEGISLYTFLRISPRKINILKTPKLDPRELYEVNVMNVKKNTVQFNEYFEIYCKNVKKMKKK